MLKESTTEDGLTRKQQDIEVVSSLFDHVIDQHLGVDPSISRAPLPWSEKPRFLKITVSSDAEKAAILRK